MFATNKTNTFFQVKLIKVHENVSWKSLHFIITLNILDIIVKVEVIIPLFLQVFN